MVKFSPVLLRVPLIKFRKGGLGHSSPGASSPATAAAPAAATPVSSGAPTTSCAFQAARAAPMSTGAISDVDLPLRYRRQPLSQEEIDHINGGGIV